ncbi:LOW QUALITY PROTEIN: hypothetical protein Cgig2_017455 [Carnegiea gigantea]|uniref:Aminotransferase-like plant mobile domain-containing protein n=1 Tax=Carnegiea gigantea TaxID=171969 RepID=A0A9Q1JNX4_9CARY|nr:LOW QUALITY PROTEIN: hypothetical protein Cgig2_017455 [Carnegiea gigantea]
MELCEENIEEDREGYGSGCMRSFGVFFPRTPYGASWSLLHYVDDVDGMGQYAWAEAICQVVVKSIEDTQRKLACGPLSEYDYLCRSNYGTMCFRCTCMLGYCEHRRSQHRVCYIVSGAIYKAVTQLLSQLWFYDHTTRFSDQDGERFRWIASWHKVDHGGMSDATELLAELEESEARGAELREIVVRAYMDTNEYRFYVVDGEGVLSFDERLRRVREAYALEKEEFGAGNGDAGQGAEAAGGVTFGGVTFSGATLTEGTGKPSGLGGAATQDPSSPPNNVNANLSADTENVTIFTGEADVQSEPAVQGANENYEQAHPVDVDDGGIASTAQSVQSAAKVAAEDANSVPPTTDSVPVSDGDAGMGEEPLIVGDGGHCVADMGTSTTTHAGDDQSCPRSSNMVSRMKKVPRLRKPSCVWGLSYTNPTRGMKGGKKGLKSTATVNTGSGHRSPSTVHGDVVSDEDAISVVPITVFPTEGEVDAHAVPDAALNDDVPDTSTFGPSPHVPAPPTRGTGSKFVICEEGVKACTYSQLFILGARASRTISGKVLQFKTQLFVASNSMHNTHGCRNFDLPEASEKHVNAEFLKGLINVVPTRRAADRPGRYCIGSFAVHQYCKLLDFCQREHKRYCRMFVFLDRHDQKVAIGLALMKLPEFTDVLRWEMEHADCPHGHDCGVYMLMFMDLLSIRLTGATSVSLMCARLVTNYFLAFSRGALLTSHKPSCRIRKWRFGEGGQTCDSPCMYIK